MQLNKILHTDGQGWWSETAKNVGVVHMTVPYINDDNDFGELRVYFNPADWNVNEHGLIYTDRRFLHELKSLLDHLGLPGRDVGYSEQGMQGDDYVSLDVGHEFIQAWNQRLVDVAV